MTDDQRFVCICGSESVAADSQPELACSCGRIYEIESPPAGRVVLSDPITPEARQPLASFSRELRGLEDSQRFRFTHVITRGHRLPVHILFSPSLERAEVATGDMKPLRLESVGSVIEARRKWVAWFESLRKNAPKRSGSATLEREYSAGQKTCSCG